MPVDRIPLDFKDISMSFQINPLTQDLVALKNENAIARSIRNIVLTEPGEKFFNPRFGSEVSTSLFENITDLNADTLRRQITQSIQVYENRVRLIDVVVSPNYEYLEYNVTITYQVIGIEALPQQLSFPLQSTR
jgi:phage baseplate assembly protein W